tara:strand:+ start:121 stop:369 length:249 start_codon:yes stop_codon:yes gene_type:complete
MDQKKINELAEKSRKIDELAETLTFTQLNRLIGRVVQLGWLEFTQDYSNELGDFENYKDVFIESLTEDFDDLEEPNKDLVGS